MFLFNSVIRFISITEIFIYYFIEVYLNKVEATHDSEARFEPNLGSM